MSADLYLAVAASLGAIALLVGVTIAAYALSYSPSWDARDEARLALAWLAGGPVVAATWPVSLPILAGLALAQLVRIARGVR